MAFQQQKNGDDPEILVYGFEKGVAPSPYKGIASIQNGNIATEEGEVMASYGRLQSSMTDSNSTGSLSFVDTSHVALNISNTNNKFKGMWITVSASTHSGELANGTYYVINTASGNNFVLTTAYGASGISGYTAGLTATIALLRRPTRAIGYATETYYSGGTQYYRYYILDSQGLVWVYDTVNDLFPSDDEQYWFLPETSISYFGSDAAPSGIAVLNGWLLVFAGNKIWTKQTVNLGASFVQMTNAYLMSQATSLNPHFAYVGHQGRAYWTDGDFIGSMFPDTSILSGVSNVQSYAQWSGSSTTGTIAQLISGSIPSTGANVGATGFSRIPAVFFPAAGGTLPSALSAHVVYYIQYSTANANFQVFAALTGGSALDVASGSSGNQYFNTFYVVGTHAGAYGDTPLMTWTPQRVDLPVFETSQCMTEIGNVILIGCKSATMYPWNQVAPTPQGIISLPEQNVQSLLTVNQMAYVFAGYKGNIYITDGSVASLALKIPDYCAGIPGTPSSYIEPYFVWGGTMYVRGRVYFSVLDQRLIPQSSVQQKAGNCGGVWSFYPTQNLAYGQDTGLALRLENQNSYGTYNGYATVLIPWFDQNSTGGPQYWSAWQSSIVVASATYGFDKTATAPVGTVVIETDLMPVGTVLNKYTPKQLEYKMGAPLTAGETITVAWRKNATDAYTSAGTVIQPDGNTGLAGYYNANFQGAQWVQLRITMTPQTDVTTSFTRLSQFLMR